MPKMLRTHHRIDLIPSALAIFNDAMTARKFPAMRSDISVGFNTMTLFAGLSVEKVNVALPWSLPKESVFNDIRITDKIQESLA